MNVLFFKNKEMGQDTIEAESMDTRGDKDAFLLWRDFGDYIEMRQIFVKEECRQQRLGYKLMKEVEKQGKDIYIFATPSGQDVFGKFLKKLGYRKINIKRAEVLGIGLRNYSGYLFTFVKYA